MNTNSIEHVRKQLFGLCLCLRLFFHSYEHVAMRHKHVFLSFYPEDSAFWESTSRYLFLWAGIFCDFWEQKCEKQRSIDQPPSERQYRVIQSLSEIVSNSEKQTSAMLSQECREWLYNCVWNECFKLKERPNVKVISI